MKAEKEDNQRNYVAKVLIMQVKLSSLIDFTDSIFLTAPATDQLYHFSSKAIAFFPFYLLKLRSLPFI